MVKWFCPALGLDLCGSNKGLVMVLLGYFMGMGIVVCVFFCYSDVISDFLRCCIGDVLVLYVSCMGFLKGFSECCVGQDKNLINFKFKNK